MGLLDIFNHLLNFALPALAVGTLTTVAARALRRLMGRPRSQSGFWASLAMTCAAGLGVLMLGLALSANDGKMHTYMALVLACATVQWWQQRH